MARSTQGVSVIGHQVVGQRAHQEDSWAVGMLAAGGAWAVVADGLGGHRDGKAASQTAVDAITQHIQRTLPPIGDMAWMLAGINQADAAVHALALPHENTPPATTLLWAVADARRVWIAHIGDSRAYLVHGHTVTPLTVDMTPAGDRVARGEAAWDSQNTAPDAHILHTCVGIPPVAVDAFSEAWMPGDSLVITSDGLNPIPLAEWAHVVKWANPLRVLDQASWHDNATLAILQNA